jgi:hypothetical protein
MSPFDAQGGLGKMWQLFGEALSVWTRCWMS